MYHYGRYITPYVELSLLISKKLLDWFFLIASDAKHSRRQLLFMPVPVMEVWHVIVLVFFLCMFMLMRMCAYSP